jgi:uncharacterized flavoprotein (TIGR03862 family)
MHNTVVPLAIIGAGPAGLMAAEAAANAGVQNIHVFDAMPSVGRKLLLAGIGGLNITHNEAQSAFIQRYQPENTLLTASIQDFDAQALRDWCAALGVATFVGSSGRVFPSEMKAAPLLRAWLARLKSQGVQFHSRHRWLGWRDVTAADATNHLCFETPQGVITVTAQATLLALGGGSWRKLGSDGAWQSPLVQRGVTVNPLVPANCGFNVAWSDFFKTKCAGAALKNIAIVQGDTRKIGELIITAHGVEGSLVYAHSAAWRDAIAAQGTATIYLDLLPNHSETQVLAACQHPRGTRSMASHLSSRLGVSSTAFTLLRECLPVSAFNHAASLAAGIKALPISPQSTRPLDEAISSAGGVAWKALGDDYQLIAMPSVFCAGEMLDWEAPTGGYLLTACWATGRSAGLGASGYLAKHLRT